MALHISKIEITNDILVDDYMVVTIYIVSVLIAVMNTWYLTTQLRLKKGIRGILLRSTSAKNINKETKCRIF